MWGTPYVIVDRLGRDVSLKYSLKNYIQFSLVKITGICGLFSMQKFSLVLHVACLLSLQAHHHTNRPSCLNENMDDCLFLQVAVLLLDTQGTNDNRMSSQAIDALVASYCLLLSSVQIFTVNQHLNMNDLDCLQVGDQGAIQMERIS